MADFSKFSDGVNVYTVKDAQARADIEEIKANGVGAASGKVEEISKEDYENLSEEELNEGKIYAVDVPDSDVLTLAQVNEKVESSSLTYDEDNNLLFLKSGNRILSSVHIEGGSIATIIHVETHEEAWWNNPNVTIDVNDGEEDIDNGHFNSVGDYVCNVHHLGTYTVTVTDEDGTKYKSVFTDNALGEVLYVWVEKIGWRNWIKTIGKDANIYTSLDDALVDEKLVRELMTRHISVDYMADVWFTANLKEAKTVLNNDIVAKWINLRDYALDKIYSIPEVKKVADEVDKYGYGEWALMPQVPTMTSNTTPKGLVTASSYYKASSYPAWKAFDGKVDTLWLPATGENNSWIQYDFNDSVAVCRLCDNHSSVGTVNDISCELHASNDNFANEDDTLVSYELTKTNLVHDVSFKNIKAYKNYRLIFKGVYLIKDNNNYVLNELQFYAWQSKGNVPVMTSNTAPYGEAIADGYGTASTNWGPIFKAFDGVRTDGWAANETKSSGDKSESKEHWVGYKFTNPICVRRVDCIAPNGMGTTQLRIEYSNDGSNWIGVFSKTYLEPIIEAINSFENEVYALYWRVSLKQKFTTSYGNIPAVATLQFYGRELKVSVPVMTSDTTPYGEVFGSEDYNIGSYSKWHVFDGTDSLGSTKSTSQTSDLWFAYDFGKPVCIRKYIEKVYTNNGLYDVLIQVQGTNDRDGEWVTVHEHTYQHESDKKIYVYSFENDKSFRYWRVFAPIAPQRDTTYWCYPAYQMQFYGLDYTEREFEEGSTTKYLYDHGLELVEIGYYTQNNGIIEKTSYNIIQRGGNTVNGQATIYVKGMINLTNYTIGRVVLSDILYSTRSEKTVASMQAWNSELLKLPNMSGIAVSAMSAAEPFNNSLDLSSVNGVKGLAITNGSGAANINDVSSVTEWWLE